MDHKNTAAEVAQMHGVQMSENIVYLMGFSFMLGCFFTILVLILLDFMRRNTPPQK